MSSIALGFTATNRCWPSGEQSTCPLLENICPISAYSLVTESFSMSTTRHRARQAAVQLLYQQDLNPDTPASAARELLREQLDDEARERFAWGLFVGTIENRKQIDEKVQAVAVNWSISRMPVTDRSVIRLGAYEILFTDTPHTVAISEALSLAKAFGGPSSAPFVNGILDRLVPEEKRAKLAEILAAKANSTDADLEDEDTHAEEDDELIAEDDTSDDSDD
jgi:N utilization substance protein B